MALPTRFEDENIFLLLHLPKKRVGFIFLSIFQFKFSVRQAGVFYLIDFVLSE
jgi:hypothetical protein